MTSFCIKFLLVKVWPWQSALSVSFTQKGTFFLFHTYLLFTHIQYNHLEVHIRKYNVSFIHVK